MSRWIDIRKDPQHIARERAKARKLRDSIWWREKLQEGVCHYCGEKFSPEDLTMDHIVPVARGGYSKKSNLVVSCDACNKDKGVLTPVEMILDKLEVEENNSQAKDYFECQGEDDDAI